MDNGQIEMNLREKLKKFPLYNDDHWILVDIGKGVCIGYAPTLERDGNLDKTRFDLEIKEDTCHINGFNIEKEKRDKAYGSLLYDIIEKFCIEQFNCKVFETTIPCLVNESLFWEKKGFRYKSAIVIEKVLD